MCVCVCVCVCIFTGTWLQQFVILSLDAITEVKVMQFCFGEVLAAIPQFPSFLWCALSEGFLYVVF